MQELKVIIQAPVSAVDAITEGLTNCGWTTPIQKWRKLLSHEHSLKKCNREDVRQMMVNTNYMDLMVLSSLHRDLSCRTLEDFEEISAYYTQIKADFNEAERRCKAAGENPTIETMNHYLGEIYSERDDMKPDGDSDE